MKTKLPSIDSSSVSVRLGICAAALAGTAAGVPQAQATVVSFSGPFVVPATFQGLYINFATGSVTGAPATGWDFNPYSNAGPFAIYWAGGAAGTAGGVTTGPGSTTYADLTVGSVIGSGSNFSNALQVGTATGNLLPLGNHILGFRFVNEATGITNYGYLTLTSGSSNGFPLTILGWSFEDSGAAITVVPEPATVAFLTMGVLAIGAAGLRTWRKRQAS
jgi:hypothetical protein